MKFADINKNKNNSNILMIIVIVGAIFIGIIVFSISNLFVSKPNRSDDNDEQVETKTDLELDSKKVTSLYNYVTYGDNDIYLKNPNVKLDNFNNYDKFYYMSSLIKKKDIEEIDEKESGNKLNTIKYSKIKEYMEKYFGPDVEFEKNSNVTVILPFDLNDKNICNLTYNENLTAYTVGCSEKKEIKSDAYRELVSAKESGDNIIIKERVLFIDTKEENGRVSFDVYKDYNHTILITSGDIEKNDFSLDNIMKENRKKSITIKYTYKKNKKDHYLYSSKISD